jgi:predicted site-specific integrase-resolvase
VLGRDVEVPPSGLVNAALAAQIAGVKPGTIRQWRRRGHLDVARDVDGRELLSNEGHVLFEVLAVIEAEYKLRERARRQAISYA